MDETGYYSAEDSSDTEAAEYDEEIKSLKRKQELADIQIRDLERKLSSMVRRKSNRLRG